MRTFKEMYREFYLKIVHSMTVYGQYPPPPEEWEATPLKYRPYLLGKFERDTLKSGEISPKGEL